MNIYNKGHWVCERVDKIGFPVTPASIRATKKEAGKMRLEDI